MRKIQAISRQVKNNEPVISRPPCGIGRVWVYMAVLLMASVCGCAGSSTRDMENRTLGLRLTAFGRVEKKEPQNILKWRFILYNFGVAPLFVHNEEHTATYHYSAPESSGSGDITGPSYYPTEDLYRLLYPIPIIEGKRVFTSYDFLEKRGETQMPLDQDLIAQGEVSVSAQFVVLQASVRSGKVEFSKRSVHFEVPLQPMPKPDSP